MYQDRTLIFGHQGAKAYAPTNTLPAFELALQQGADGIELDVHRTKDGHIVVVHDFTVDATTDGNGEITQMRLAELKELDAGQWFDTRFTGTRIPTLDEVFEAVGQKLYINVEIKSNTPDTLGLEQLVAESIHKFGMEARVIVSSFDPDVLLRFRKILPQVPLGYLYVPGQSLLLLDQIRPEALHPFYEMIDTSYMVDAKANRYRINTWTVNNTDHAHKLRDLGVDAIITDNPDKLIDALA